MKNHLTHFLLLLLFIASCTNRKRADLNIIFDRVDNIEVGGEVKMHGYTIGEVTSLKLLDTDVLVGVRVKQKIKIPIGSQFYLSSPLVGVSTINIEPSSETFF